MIKYIILIKILLLTLSCFNNSKNDNLVEAFPIDTIEFKISNNLIKIEDAIFLPSFNDHVNLLVIINGTKKEIEFYSIETTKKVDSIPLKHVFDKSTTPIKTIIAGFNILNEDSIFVLPYYTNEIFLINKSGSVNKRWVISSKRNNNEEYGFAPSGFNKVYTYKKGLLINQFYDVTDYATNLVSQDKYYNSKNDILISFTDRDYKIEDQIGEYPNQYKKEVYFDDFAPSRILDNNGIAIYSYGISNEIFIHDINTKRKYIKEAKSIFEKPFIPFNTDSLQSRRYTEKYRTENNKYFYIIDDAYRNRYYRIFLHQFNYLNKDGSTNSPFDKPFSLIILDKEFNLQGEVVFANDYFNVASIIPINEGVLINVNNPKNPIFNPEYLKYVLYKFTL